MDEQIKHWTAMHKCSLLLKITLGETTVLVASRAYELLSSEFES
jgi:hypothetical protein